MSSNLVSSVTQILSSKLLERFSSGIGLQKGQIEDAMQAGVPAVLAALSSLVSKPGGAAALKEAVDQQPSGALTKLTNAIGGSGQNALLDSAVSGLTSLLGSATTSAISNAIGQYARIGSAHSSSIMGLLGSTVMAALGQQQRSQNLDASGLAQLLTSQTTNIAKALPAGVSKYLSGTGVFDGLSETDDDRPMPRSYSYSASPSYAVAPKTNSMQWGWLLPALVLLGIGSLAWHLYSRPDTTAAVTTPQPEVAANAPMSTKIETPLPPNKVDTEEAPSSTGTSTGVAGVGPAPSPSATAVLPANFQALENLHGINVGDVDLGAQTTNAVNDLRGSLAKITDEASARAALASLSGSAEQFNKVDSLAGRLSPENRKSLASVITKIRPALDQLFDSALQVPGASAVIKPTIDSIRAKLDTLTTA